MPRRKNPAQKTLWNFATHKRCPKCKEIKPVSDFGIARGNANGLRPRCRKCIREDSKARHLRFMNSPYHERQKKLMRIRARKLHYGISDKDYRELLEKQGGTCAICKSASNHQGKVRQYAFHVDHDHATGKVRGLLCNHCNLGLGNFSDDVQRLQQAIDYLLAHKETC